MIRDEFNEHNVDNKLKDDVLEIWSRIDEVLWGFFEADFVLFSDTEKQKGKRASHWTPLKGSARHFLFLLYSIFLSIIH